MAVVRVKRYLTEEPSEALLFQYKRRKIEGNEEKTYDLEQSTVLRFAGTLKDQSEDVSHLMTKPAKDQLEANFKKPNLDSIAKLRARKQLESKNSRYKIVSCFRSKHVVPEKEGSEEITVYDVETAVDRLPESNENPGGSKDGLTKDSTEENSDSNSNEASSVSKSEQDYVYDVYYTNSTNFAADTDMEQQYINLYQVDDSLDWGPLADNGMDSYYDNEEDSDDSNAENNYRNDYPEEESTGEDEDEDGRSIDENDMIAAFQKVHLEGADHELSSDSDQDLYDEEDANDLNYFDEFDEEHLRFAKAFRKFIKSKDAPEPEPDSDGSDENALEQG